MPLHAGHGFVCPYSSSLPCWAGCFRMAGSVLNSRRTPEGLRSPGRERPVTSVKRGPRPRRDAVSVVRARLSHAGRSRSSVVRLGDRKLITPPILVSRVPDHQTRLWVHRTFLAAEWEKGRPEGHPVAGMCPRLTAAPQPKACPPTTTPARHQYIRLAARTDRHVRRGTVQLSPSSPDDPTCGLSIYPQAQCPTSFDPYTLCRDRVEVSIGHPK